MVKVRARGSGPERSSGPEARGPTLGDRGSGPRLELYSKLADLKPISPEARDRSLRPEARGSKLSALAPEPSRNHSGTLLRNLKFAPLRNSSTAPRSRTCSMGRSDLVRYVRKLRKIALGPCSGTSLLNLAPRPRCNILLQNLFFGTSLWNLSRTSLRNHSGTSPEPRSENWNLARKPLRNHSGTLLWNLSGIAPESRSRSSPESQSRTSPQPRSSGTSLQNLALEPLQNLTPEPLRNLSRTSREPRSRTSLRNLAPERSPEPSLTLMYGPLNLEISFGSFGPRASRPEP